ncbi:hypothetical protein IJG90_03180, partial [Candidatus Saccharibacteria bacterium]|nr:hypothetical protein [Candidatus Saccharibacteria bacterium]
GYTLSMTAADVNLTRTAAVNGATPTIPTFTSLSGYTSGTTYSQANFPPGYWGDILSSDTNFLPLKSSITIADPDESTANTAISNIITFAAKLDNSKPAGSYTTTLTFTATGKTPPITLISFTINGTTYQAEDGMTWGEWVNSDYNIDGYTIDYEYATIRAPVDTSPPKYVSDSDDGSSPSPSSTIVANHSFYAGPLPIW